MSQLLDPILSRSIYWGPAIKWNTNKDLARMDGVTVEQMGDYLCQTGEESSNAKF